MAALVLVLVAFGACGGDDDDDGGDTEDSGAELSSSLPTGGELGFEERSEWEWDDATEFVLDGLVIGGSTEASDVGGALEDAGFQAAAGNDLVSIDGNVRLRALEFDSEDGALEARDLLHDEDLKTPCPDACIVTPLEYELSDVPDSTAVHHVPTRGDVPPGQSKVEAHHAEFAIGPRLYVVQVDGPPSPTFSDDFGELMGTVYESASASE